MDSDLKYKKRSSSLSLQFIETPNSLKNIKALPIVLKNLSLFDSRRTEDVRQLNIHAPGGPVERRVEPSRSNLNPSWPQPAVTRPHSVRSQKDTELPGTRGTWDTVKCGRVGGVISRMDSLVSESRAAANIASMTDQPAGPLAASRWNYEPREIILQLACDFLSSCSSRLAEMGERQRIPELLDPKSHMVS